MEINKVETIKILINISNNNTVTNFLVLPFARKFHTCTIGSQILFTPKGARFAKKISCVI